MRFMPGGGCAEIVGLVLYLGRVCWDGWAVRRLTAVVATVLSLLKGRPKGSVGSHVLVMNRLMKKHANVLSACATG